MSVPSYRQCTVRSRRSRNYVHDVNIVSRNHVRSYPNTWRKECDVAIRYLSKHTALFRNKTFKQNRDKIVPNSCNRVNFARFQLNQHKGSLKFCFLYDRLIRVYEQNKITQNARRIISHPFAILFSDNDIKFSSHLSTYKLRIFATISKRHWLVWRCVRGLQFSPAKRYVTSQPIHMSVADDIVSGQNRMKLLTTGSCRLVVDFWASFFRRASGQKTHVTICRGGYVCDGWKHLHCCELVFFFFHRLFNRSSDQISPVWVSLSTHVFLQRYVTEIRRS